MAAVLTSCSFNAPLHSNEDGEPISVSFETATTGSDEQSSLIRVALVLSDPAREQIIVDCVVAGTATSDSDFTIANPTVTFEIGEARKDIEITILPDSDELESNETIELALEAEGLLIGAIDKHTINLSNVVLPRITFTATDTNTPEGTQTMLVVALDKPTVEAASVTLEITNSTATVAEDFTLASQIIEFPAGTTQLVLPIGEVNDALDEEDEDVVFLLREPSPNVLIGTVATQTHTITDDDPLPTVQFAGANSDIDEAIGAMALTVVLDAPSGRIVSIGYARDGNDSATAADATVAGSPGTLTFAPGETSKTIDISITNDGTDENDETVTVNLSTATNAMLGTATRTTTILDDDDMPAVRFEDATSSGNEDDFLSFQIVQIELTAASGKNVSVPYTRSGNCNDCSVDSSPVTFAPGETSRTILINWSNDNSIEGDETVVLTIGNTPTNATRGSPSNHTFTLDDG